MNLKFLFLFLIFLFSSALVLASEKIDINTASLEDLIKIIHIGEKRGRELISLRPFSSLNDLSRIKGIGLKRIADIKKQGLAWVNEGVSVPQPPAQQPFKGLSKTLESKVPKSIQIDINTAPLEELIKIVHIGNARAQQLISLRPFYSLDDLTRIRGIGEKSLEDIKKQGLAWVDQNLKPPAKEKSNLPEKGAASAASSFESSERNSKSLFLFLTALTLSIFSGIIILAIKRKLKTREN